MQSNSTIPNTLTNTKSKISQLQVSNIDKIVFLVCIVDTLFLPYLRVVSASVSMIVLPIWFLFNLKKIKVTSEHQFFFVLVFLSILSVLMSRFDYATIPYMQSNITNLLILLIGFFYYFFYKYFFHDSKSFVTKILSAYMFFGTTLAAIYLLNPSLYFYVRSFWTLNGNVIEVNNSLTIFRFTSTFSDPNNAAVAFVGVMTFLLLNQKFSFVTNFLLIGSTTVIVFATMSSTGFLLLAISVSFYLFTLIKEKGFTRFKKSTLLYLSLLCMFSPVIVGLIFNLIGSDFAQIAIERVSGNSADSRYAIWFELLQSENILKYIVSGLGGTLIIDGYLFRPHNGHLHLIYNYGMIVYAIFIFIFFRKRKYTTFKSYFFLVPFFLGFTVNVGIYEPRFITLLALLVAFYSAESNRIPNHQRRSRKRKTHKVASF